MNGIKTKTKMSSEETVNKTIEDIKNTKLYTEGEVIDIIWEAVNEIESSYNIPEVIEEFIKNKFVNNQNKDESNN